MWLFTQYGFFSVVCARQGRGAVGQPVDLDRMMVRSRSKEHLVALQQRFEPQLGESPIVETDNSDYRYRIFIPKIAWNPIQSALADEIDYDNFKSAVSKAGGTTEYLHALHDVWSVLR